MIKTQKIKTIEDLNQFLKEFFKDKDINKKLSQLKYILEESNLPYKVDIVDLNNAPYLKEKGKRWL